MKEIYVHTLSAFSVYWGNSRSNVTTQKDVNTRDVNEHMGWLRSLQQFKNKSQEILIHSFQSNTRTQREDVRKK